MSNYRCLMRLPRKRKPRLTKRKREIGKMASRDGVTIRVVHLTENLSDVADGAVCAIIARTILMAGRVSAP